MLILAYARCSADSLRPFANQVKRDVELSATVVFDLLDYRHIKNAYPTFRIRTINHCSFPHISNLVPPVLDVFRLLF